MPTVIYEPFIYCQCKVFVPQTVSVLHTGTVHRLWLCQCCSLWGRSCLGWPLKNHCSNSQLNSTMKENVSCSRLNVDQEVLKVFLRETLIVNNQNERTVLP